MSKSNAVEIISVLYIIAALLADGFHQPRWVTWSFVFFALENLVESVYHAYKEHTS